MMNKKLLFILLTLASLSFVGCGDTNGTNDDPDKQEGKEEKEEKGPDKNDTEYSKDRVLPKLYEHFVQMNITEAEEYSEMLTEVTTAICKEGKTAKCAHHEDKMEGEKCLQLAFLELSEYSTKRLEMFNNFAFQKTVYDTINGEMTKLEKLAYGTLPTKGSSDCTELTSVASTIATGVTSLRTAWTTNKDTFISASDPDTGIKKVFEGIAKAVTNETEKYISEPAGLDPTSGEDDSAKTADASKTAAPTGNVGGWVVYQAVYRGPNSAYIGDYKDITWKSTLEGYLKAKDESKATALTNAFSGIKTSFTSISSHNDATNSLEQAITSQKWNELKTVILSLVQLSTAANAAAQ